MCGILAIIGALKDCSAQSFDSALDTLSHRGPDGRGVYISPAVSLGHRRLSIIDLTAGGAQPMTDPVTGCVVTYNGEIYNYLELRRELQDLGHHFTTQSDTEVLLKAYAQWGADSFRRFNGMWSLCLWDPRQRTAIVSRDRFGVKPLYYHCTGAAVVFASEPKAIIRLAASSGAVDERSVARFLGLSELVSSESTFYSTIKALPAGTFARLSPNDTAVRPERYWQVSLESRQSSGADALERFSYLLDDSVRLRMRSDVPVGLALSGGLDSSAILAGMAKAGGDPICFTAIYDQNLRGEEEWASRAAAHFHAHVIPVEANRTSWLETLQRITWHMDGPGYSPAVYPTWAIMREARRRAIPVILEGQGADELLAGYPQYLALHLLNELHSLRLRAAISGIRTGSRTFGSAAIASWLVRLTFPRAFVRYREARGSISLLNDEIRRNYLMDAPRSPLGVTNFERGSHLNRTLANDFFRDILPSLLQYGDAISMAHSIESRLPFLDYRLVDFAFEAPDDVKISAGRTKRVLREYLDRHGLTAIAQRKDKKGYPTPLGHWLDVKKKGEPIQLITTSAKLHRFCNPRAIAHAVSDAARGSWSAQLILYKLLSLEMWLRNSNVSI